jgi:hypothetical protein
MRNAPTDQQGTANDLNPDGTEPVPEDYASSVPPPEFSGHDHPRLVEEHHVRGPYGEDEVEATDELGRRWYHLRPEPRRRYDLIGFNYTWWLIWIVFLLLVFAPWGRGWGY